MRTLLRLMRYQAVYKRLVFFSIVSLVAYLALEGAAPAAISVAINEGLAKDDGGGALAVFALLAAGLFLARGLLSAIFNFLWQYQSRLIERNLRDDFYAHLQRLSYSFYDRADSGDLISRGISDIEAARMASGMGLFRMGEILGKYAVVLVIMFSTSTRLALWTLASMPLMIATTIYFSRELRRRWVRVQAQRSIMTSTLTEALTGARVVKAFAQEEAETDRFERTVRDLTQYFLDTIKQYSFFLPILVFLSSLGTIALIWVGFSMVIDQEIAVGTVVQFNIYVAMLFGPTRGLGAVVQRLQNGIAAAERVFETLDLRPDVEGPAEPAPREPMSGHIRFEGVDFGYGHGEMVLHDIEVDIKPGSTVGIIGPTGAGKTTLVGLIGRHYDPRAGRVTIDGRDVREYDLEWLRRNLATVPQDPYLFTNMMDKNIAYARPESGRAEIEAAAAQAQAGRFIDALPEGYDTIVGERGVGLSGGQRQRVTISRALLMDAPILIMDDSTSNVDTGTERLIRDAMKESFEGRTTIVVGQRVGSVMDADEILVMDEGRVVERGVHEDLVAAGRLYAEILRLQSPATEGVEAGE
ncbi:MAG: ABC transporter ATP-binding protein [Chloroflexota bacterium]|jgi:ATP-binding cassette subfamily B protein|nr:ABC transporter ATP-binding protein [Chloroflexota bacterium]MDP6757021.1 ABC transporter ATP-binding protein [Chloroflexota bacterium]